MIMWPFVKKSKPVFVPRAFEVPSDKVTDILILYDRQKQSGYRSDKHLLWEAIKKLFPEIEGYNWKIIFPGTSRICIIELPPQNWPA